MHACVCATVAKLHLCVVMLQRPNWRSLFMPWQFRLQRRRYCCRCCCVCCCCGLAIITIWLRVKQSRFSLFGFRLSALLYAILMHFKSQVVTLLLLLLLLLALMMSCVMCWALAPHRGCINVNALDIHLICDRWLAGGMPLHATNTHTYTYLPMHTHKHIFTFTAFQAAVKSSNVGRWLPDFLCHRKLVATYCGHKNAINEFLWQSGLPLCC